MEGAGVDGFGGFVEGVGVEVVRVGWGEEGGWEDEGAEGVVCGGSEDGGAVGGPEGAFEVVVVFVVWGVGGFWGGKVGFGGFVNERGF